MAKEQEGHKNKPVFVFRPRGFQTNKLINFSGNILLNVDHNQIVLQNSNIDDTLERVAKMMPGPPCPYPTLLFTTTLHCPNLSTIYAL